MNTNKEIKGILIPIGGNEDKGVETSEVYHLEYIEDGILARVVQEAGGVNAKIIVIPTASRIPVEVADNYKGAFFKLGCTDINIMDIRKRSETDTPENLELMRKANCVMFSGGDQSKIVDKIGNTELHRLMQQKYEDEEFVIAGTSAGAMCMSKEMISGGSASESFKKGVVRMRDGMSFVPKLIIDSHFITRGRFGRLAGAVAQFPNLMGIGLAEDTGIVIKNCNRAEVIGSGMVILFNPRKLKYNNYEMIKEGTPTSLTNLVTHILANGDRFNIKNRKIKVLPAIEEELA